MEKDVYKTSNLTFVNDALIFFKKNPPISVTTKPFTKPVSAFRFKTQNALNKSVIEFAMHEHMNGK